MFLLDRYLIRRKEGIDAHTAGNEKKFADFIKLCSEAKAQGVGQVTVAYPWVLGDTYEELIESLARLADAERLLHVAARKNWPSQKKCCQKITEVGFTRALLGTALASYNLLSALSTSAQGGGLAEGFLEPGFDLRSASGEVERRQRGASSEPQPERNAAAEPQTEARRSRGRLQNAARDERTV